MRKNLHGIWKGIIFVLYSGGQYLSVLFGGGEKSLRPSFIVFFVV